MSLAELIDRDIAAWKARGASELRLKISRNCEAKVTFSGTVTQDAITKLVALLEMSKDTFPTGDDTSTAEPSAASTLPELPEAAPDK